MRITKVNYYSSKQHYTSEVPPAPVRQVHKTQSPSLSFGSNKVKRGILALLFPGLLAGCSKQLVSRVESSDLPEIMVHQFTKGHYTPIPQIRKLESSQGTLYVPNLYSGKRYPTQTQIKTYANGILTFKTDIYLNPRKYVDTDLKELCIPIRYSDDPMVRELPREVQQSLEECNMATIDNNCIKGLKRDTNTVVLSFEQRIPKEIEDTIDLRKMKDVRYFHDLWKNGNNKIMDFRYIKNNREYLMEDPKLYLITGDTIHLNDYIPKKH